MSTESNIERDRRKRSLIDTPPHPSRRCFGYAAIEPLCFIGKADLPEGATFTPGALGTSEFQPRAAYDDFRFSATREFRTRPGKIKPGSLTERGGIIYNDLGEEAYLTHAVVRLPHCQPLGRYSAWQRCGWSIDFIDSSDGKTYVELRRAIVKPYRPGRCLP